MNYSRRIQLVFSGLAFLSTVSIMACESIMPEAPKPEDLLAEPISGLSGEQLQNHLAGDEEFGRVFGVMNGLGPIFVSNSCESCHVGDGQGHPSIALTRYNKIGDPDFDPLASIGGHQLQHRAIPGYIPETLPSPVKGHSSLTAPSVSGLGYLAAVSDADILAMADPNDSNGDGISGVPSYIPAPAFFTPQPFHIKDNTGRYIGRFGKKAGAIDLLQQTSNAYLMDMGITSHNLMNDLFNENAGNHSGDNIPDPEVPGSVVNNVVFYLRTIKTPPRRNAQKAEVLEGEKLFAQVGCAKCHVPTLKTGNSDIQALSNQQFHPYTDLLLHDMGDQLDDNYTEGSARTSEWRTPPLWGVGLSQDSQGGQLFLLHDGRARSFEEAINYHGGEATNSRNEFRKLSSAEKQNLVEFLKSI